MDNKPKRLDKYLTDLKELPADTKDHTSKVKSEVKPKAGEFLDKSKTIGQLISSSSKAPKIKTGANSGEELQESLEKTSLKTVEKQPVVENDDELDDFGERSYTIKDVILGVINFLSVILLIFILVVLPKKAEELKLLRIENAKNSLGNSGYTVTTENIDKGDELQKLFLDDFGVVNFAVEIEKLKLASPAIKRVSFTSQKPVKDRLGISGIPVVIVLEGSWESVGFAMNSIEALPYLFRPVSIKSDVGKDDTTVITLNYGGILYVGDKFTKN